MFLPLQAPAMQAQLASPAADAVSKRIAELERAEQWPELADYFESLDANQRGVHLSDWLRAMNKAQRWERLLHVCELVLPQMEGKPKLALPWTLARNYRAHALSGLARHAEAAAAYEQNWTDLKDRSNLRNACIECRMAPDWPRLERCSGVLLETEPQDAEALAWKGEALARQDRFDEAQPILKQSLGLDPTQAMPWSNLGRCLNEKKAWTEAKEALDHAVQLDPTLMEAHYNRGRCDFELKRYAESVEDFKAALALNPKDPVLQENLHQAERYLHPATNGPKPSHKSSKQS